jgi:hypothetical protein
MSAFSKASMSATAFLLGGNQGGGVGWDEVCVANFPQERVVGYRWPSSR